MKRKKVLRFPLAGPLERRGPGGLSNHQIEIPRIELSENQYRSRSGEWSKRPGFVQDTSVARPSDVSFADGTLSIIRKLSQVGTVPMAIARGGASNQILDDAWRLAKGKWQQMGFAGQSPAWSTRVVETDSVMSTSGTYVACETCDIASNADSSLTCLVTSRRNSSTATVPDATQAIFLDRDLKQLTGGTESISTGGVIVDPRIVFVGGNFFIFGVTLSGASSQLRVYKFADETSDINAGHALVASDLLGTGTGTPWFDVQVRTDTNRILIAYRGTGPVLRVLEWNPSTNAVSVAVQTIGAGDLASHALGWVRHDNFASQLYLVTARNDASDGVRLRVLNTTTLAQSSSLQLQASPGDVFSITGFRTVGVNDITVFWEVRAATLTQTHIRVSNSTSTVLNYTGAFYFGGSLASAPALSADGRWQLLISSADDLQPSYYLVDAVLAGSGAVGTGQIGMSATPLRGRGQGLHPRRSLLANMFAYGPTAGPNGLTGGGLLVGARQVRGVAFETTTTQTLLFAHSPLYFRYGLDYIPACRVGKGVLFGSAAPMYAAGGRCFPAGFPMDPPKPRVTVTGGGTLAAGTYGVACRFRMVDDDGDIWLSSPSPPVYTAQGVANNYPQAAIDSFSQDAGLVKTSGVTVDWFRTKKDGTIFYLTPHHRPTYFVDSSANLNISSVGVALEAAVPDDVLEQNMILDANLGELIPSPCPPMIDCVAVGDRVVVIPSERPTAVRASKATIAGLGLGFHPDLEVNILTDGPNTALAEMEGRTVVFKRQAIYVLTGDWPANNGTGLLPLAQKVATGLGTLEPASVAVTREGVWFKDPAKGICLLDRGLGIRQPGKLIDLYNANPIAGACAVEGFDQVRFVTSSSANATQGFAALMYDQVEGHWSHAGYSWGATAGDTPTAVALIEGAFYVGTAGGKVFREDPTVWADGGVTYPCRTQVRLPFAGGGAVVRVKQAALSGLAHEEVDLSCAIYNDYGGVGSGEETQERRVRQQKPGETLPAAFTVAFRPARERCESMLFDFSYTSTGQGLRLRGLAVDLGLQDARQTTRRLPTSQRS